MYPVIECIIAHEYYSECVRLEERAREAGGRSRQRTGERQSRLGFRIICLRRSAISTNFLPGASALAIMLRGNTVRLLAGTSLILSVRGPPQPTQGGLVLICALGLTGNSHPELAQAVAER